ncbi:MAG: hypothetical protein ABL984_15265, partial [Pyrinomonadaceae bacterium]
MRTIKVPTALVFVLFSLTAAFSQTNTNPPPGSPLDTRPEYQRNADAARARQNEQVRRVVNQHRSVPSSPRKLESPEQRRTADLEKRKALEEINTLLSPPAEYRIKHAEFLKDKNTGIVRVFPDRGCDKGVVVSVENLERCGGTAPIRGAGSLFSFRLNKLPSYLSLKNVLYFIGLSDIHFVDGKFVVGTKSVQDIISDIGQVELADVTHKSDSVKFLKSFKPSDTAAKVALQNENLAKGVIENGFLYSTSTPIVLNRTYVLRSIAFSTHEYGSFWNTDVLTAFKVVGQENDGSVVILWKEMKESKAPLLR